MVLAASSASLMAIKRYQMLQKLPNKVLDSKKYQ